MINFDLTLQRYFDEVKKYLRQRVSHARDSVELDTINGAYNAICAIADNPKKYAGQYDVLHKVANQQNVGDAFRHGDGVYMDVERIIYSSADLNSQIDYTRHQAQENLLKALNRIKYMNNKNPFKDFYRPFLPATYYAVKEKANQR